MNKEQLFEIFKNLSKETRLELIERAKRMNLATQINPDIVEEVLLDFVKDYPQFKSILD